MKKEYIAEIEIPEGVEINIDGNKIKAKGNEGENERDFKNVDIIFEKKDDKILLKSKDKTKRGKRAINTTKSHIYNLIKGVCRKFVYRLKICFSHFPIRVEIDKNKNEALIKNFLGEKIPRKMKILKGVEVEIENNDIILKSVDKESVGQTAANFEKSTRIKMRDRRVFQDGIFIINKSGKEI